MEEIYDIEKIKEYMEKYIYPKAKTEMTKGLLLPYLSQEELELMYDKDIALKIR